MHRRCAFSQEHPCSIATSRSGWTTGIRATNGNSVADWLREEADALGVDKFCGIVQSPESYLNSLDHLPIADDERAQIAGENLLALVA